jgi:hypothetical protein
VRAVLALILLPVLICRYDSCWECKKLQVGSGNVPFVYENTRSPLNSSWNFLSPNAPNIEKERRVMSFACPVELIDYAGRYDGEDNFRSQWTGRPVSPRLFFGYVGLISPYVMIAWEDSDPHTRMRYVSRANFIHLLREIAWENWEGGKSYNYIHCWGNASISKNDLNSNLYTVFIVIEIVGRRIHGYPRPSPESHLVELAAHDFRLAFKCSDANVCFGEGGKSIHMLLIRGAPSVLHSAVEYDISTPSKNDGKKTGGVS